MNNAGHQTTFKEKEKAKHKRWQRSTNPLTQEEWNEIKAFVKAVIDRRNNT